MNDHQALGVALEALIQSEPRDREQLPSWYVRARFVGEQIRANVELCNDVPEIVWHYLSDADIRLKDKRYAEIQRNELASLIAFFKAGNSRSG